MHCLIPLDCELFYYRDGFEKTSPYHCVPESSERNPAASQEVTGDVWASRASVSKPCNRKRKHIKL